MAKTTSDTAAISKHNEPLVVTLARQSDQKLGLTFSGGGGTKSLQITRIDPDGAAAVSGKFKVGMQLTHVNGNPCVRSKTLAVELIKASGPQLTLTLRPPKAQVVTSTSVDDCLKTLPNAIAIERTMSNVVQDTMNPTAEPESHMQRATAAPIQQERSQAMTDNDSAFLSGTRDRSVSYSEPRSAVNAMHSDVSNVSAVPILNAWETDVEVVAVTLTLDQKSTDLGFVIDGPNISHPTVGCYLFDIKRGSTAQKMKCFEDGMRIVALNRIRCTHKKQSEVLELVWESIKATGKVEFLLLDHVDRVEAIELPALTERSVFGLGFDVDAGGTPEAPGCSVKSVEPASYAYYYGMRNKMRIMRINKTFCLHWTIDQLSSHIRDLLDDGDGEIQLTLDPTSSDYRPKSMGVISSINRRDADGNPIAEVKSGFWNSGLPLKLSSFFITLASACFVVALFYDDWSYTKGPVADDEDVYVIDNSHGTKSLILNSTLVFKRLELGMIKFQGEEAFKPHVSSRPGGITSIEYSSFYDALFTVEIGRTCEQFDAINLCSQLSRAKISMWGAIVAALLACLYTDYRRIVALCTLTSSALSLVADLTWLEIIRSLGEEPILEFKSFTALTSDSLPGFSFSWCGSGVLFSVLAFGLVSLELCCRSTPVILEQQDEDPPRRREKRGFAHNLLIRIGTLLQQLGWILMVVALVDYEWATTSSSLGVASFSQYGLENATSASFGLRYFCTQGLANSDLSQLLSDIGRTRSMCFYYSENFGIFEDTKGCDVFSESYCSDTVSVGLGVFAAAFLGGIADWFSQRNTSATLLTVLSSLAGVYAIFHWTTVVHGGFANGLVELKFGRSYFALIGGLIASILGVTLSYYGIRVSLSRNHGNLSQTNVDDESANNPVFIGSAKIKPSGDLQESEM